MNWYLRTILAGLPIQALDRFKVTDPEVRAFLSRKETDAKLYVGAIQKNPNITLPELMGGFEEKEKGDTKEDYARKSEKYTSEQIEWASNMSSALRDDSYFQWLLNIAENESADITQDSNGAGHDDKIIFEAINRFKDLKDKKYLSSNPEFDESYGYEFDKSDINNYKTKSDLLRILSDYYENNNEEAYSRIGSLSGADVIFEGENGVTIIEIEDYESMNALGSKGWCVQREEEAFDDYGPPFYLFYMYKNPYALYHSGSGEFKNEHDKTMEIKDTIPLIDGVKLLISDGVLKDRRLLKSEMEEEVDEWGDPIDPDNYIHPTDPGEFEVAIDTVKTEKKINELSSRGDMKSVMGLLDENLEYASLISDYNLRSENSLNLIEGHFSNLYANFSDFKGIRKFYKSLPNILAGRYPSNESIENIIISYIENINAGTLSKTYKDTPKILKTKRVRGSFKDLFVKNIKKHHILYKGLPDEFKNEEMNSLAYQHLLARLLSKDDETIEIPKFDNLNDDFKTDEIKSAIFNAHKNKIMLNYKHYLFAPKEHREEIKPIYYESIINKMNSGNFEFNEWNDIYDAQNVKEVRSAFHAFCKKKVFEDHRNIIRFSDEFIDDDMILALKRSYLEYAKGNPDLIHEDWDRFFESYKSPQLRDLIYGRWIDLISKDNKNYYSAPKSFRDDNMKKVMKQSLNNYFSDEESEKDFSKENWRRMEDGFATPNIKDSFYNNYLKEIANNFEAYDSVPTELRDDKMQRVAYDSFFKFISNPSNNFPRWETLQKFYKSPDAYSLYYDYFTTLVESDVDNNDNNGHSTMVTGIIFDNVVPSDFKDVKMRELAYYSMMDRIKNSKKFPPRIDNMSDNFRTDEMEEVIKYKWIEHVLRLKNYSLMGMPGEYVLWPPMQEAIKNMYSQSSWYGRVRS